LAGFILFGAYLIKNTINLLYTSGLFLVFFILDARGVLDDGKIITLKTMIDIFVYCFFVFVPMLAFEVYCILKNKGK